MGDLSVDTALVPADGGDGRYRATLSEDWAIWGPNGGYLAVIALRAAGLEAQVPRPASFAAHFLAVARFEAVDVAVQVVKRGRRSESLRVSIAQDDRPILEALVRTAAEGPGLEHRFGAAPDVAEPETLKSFDELWAGDWDPYPFWGNLEGRPTNPERFDGPPKPRDPRVLDWYRFRPAASFDDPFLEAGRSLLLLDTMSWPAACRPHPESPFQAPNLDVTAWFHEPPAGSEWLLVDYVCPTAGSGLMGTQGQVWSRDGRLLASGGAQLFCVPAQPR